jgi:hypothetical protein
VHEWRCHWKTNPKQGEPKFNSTAMAEDWHTRDPQNYEKFITSFLEDPECHYSKTCSACGPSINSVT